MPSTELSTSALLHLADFLATPEAAALLDRLRAAVAGVTDSAAYRSWLGMDEQGGATCPLPDDQGHWDALHEAGLIESGRLLVKVNRHDNRHLLTDGLWVDKDIRVFPFTDESEVLLRYVRRRGLDDWARLVVDPATGSGNHAITLGAGRRCLAMDVNPRAIAYLRINAALNGTPDLSYQVNDITQGLPACVSQGLDARTLFVVNMPFALSPANRAEDGVRFLPLSADGGTTGATLTLAFLRALYGLRAVASPGKQVRAAVLCYSVGARATGRWQVVEEARRLFGASAVSFEIQSDEAMWRVNGIKAERNPMDLASGLPKKAECRFYVRDRNRDEVRAGYHELARHLSGEGWDSLAYGVLDIDVTPT